MEIPAGLAVATFDRLLERGDIVHYECLFTDVTPSFRKNKYGVIMNRDFPDDPVLIAHTTSKVAAYEETTIYDRDIIKIPAGTYSFLKKDSVLKFQKAIEEDLDVLRNQYASGKLTRKGRLLKVHQDQMDRIIEESLLLTGRVRGRCRAG